MIQGMPDFQSEIFVAQVYPSRYVFLKEVIYFTGSRQVGNTFLNNSF